MSHAWLNDFIYDPIEQQMNAKRGSVGTASERTSSNPKLPCMLGGNVRTNVAALEQYSFVASFSQCI